MVHRTNVERYPGTLQELAGELENLRYDALAVFLRALAEKLTADEEADAGRGRPRLAAALRDGSAGLAVATAAIERAWVLSAPHM